MSEPDPTPVVYCAGEIRPAAEARFDAGDHGVLFGLGFFETFRTSGARPHLWGLHQDRLSTGCARIGLALPPGSLARDPARLQQVVRALLAQARLPEATFRYTVTAGAPATTGPDPRRRFDRPGELLTLRPLPEPAPAEGVILRVLELARDEGEWQPRPKSLNYANAILGAQELRRRAATPADEGLFLNRAGDVVETTRQAVAWIRDGVVYSPGPGTGAIASTALAWLKTQVAEVHLVQERPEALVEAEAVFVLNAVRGFTPVKALWDAADRRLLAAWPSAEHALVTAFQARWNEALRLTATGAL